MADYNGPVSATVTASNGSFKVIDEWQQRADALCASITSGRFNELSVGPDDVLVVQVRTEGVPPRHVEAFLRKVKINLHSVWSRVGLADRVLYEAGSASGFSVIHIQRHRGSQGRVSEPPTIG